MAIHIDIWGSALLVKDNIVKKVRDQTGKNNDT
jgi:hypothetical protein